MERLKPCPFCGELPEIWEDNYGWFYIDCINKLCKIQPNTKTKTTKADAILSWNTLHVYFDYLRHLRKDK